MIRYIFILILSYLAGTTAQAQNVGIGTANPVEKLDVAGAIKIAGATNVAPAAGTIRWNETKNDFEGFNGQAWVSLTGGKSNWGNQKAYSTESEASNTFLNYSTTLIRSGRELGYSMAGYGNFLVAGAVKDVINSTEDIGSIHLYKRDGDDWKRTAMKIDPDIKFNGFFGGSVGISSTHIIVGAAYADDGANTREGKTYIIPYDADGSIGTATTLQPGDGAKDDYFGSSVAIDGDFAVIGARAKDFGIVPNQIQGAGKVYIYQRNGDTWIQAATLLAPDRAHSDQFGSSVVIAGDYLAVGSPQKRIDPYNQAGKVYVYQRSGSNWNLIKEITDDMPLNQEFFGSALCLKDNWLFIGGPSTSNGVGFVSAYTINGNNVTFHSKIEGSEPQLNNYFGNSIACLNNVLLIGAPGADVYASRKQGKAYAFQLVNNQWTERAILTSSQTEDHIRFGHSVALASEFGIAGAPYADFDLQINHGRIFFFRH